MPISFPWNSTEIAIRIADKISEDISVSIITVFYEGVKQLIDGVTSSDADAQTAREQKDEIVGEIARLWTDYTPLLPTEYQKTAASLTYDVAINEVQTLPKDFDVFDALMAGLSISRPDILLHQQIKGVTVRGARPDFMLGRIEIGEQAESGERALAANKTVSHEVFEKFVIENEVLSPSRFEPFKQYAQVTTKFNARTTSECGLMFLDLFQSQLLIHLKSNSKLEHSLILLAGAGVNPSVWIKMLYSMYASYLDDYLRRTAPLTQRLGYEEIVPAEKFFATITNVLLKSGEEFIVDSSIDLETAVTQFRANVVYDLMLGIAPAITLQARGRKGRLYSFAAMARQDAALGDVFYRDQSEHKISPEDLSMRESMYARLPPIDSVSDEEGYDDEAFYDMDIMLDNVQKSESNDDILKRLFTSHVLYLGQIDAPVDSELYIAALHQLWDAFVENLNCPPWIQDRKDAIKEKIVPGNLQLAEVLAGEKAKDDAFLVKLKQTMTSLATSEIKDDALLLEAVAILWMHPEVLTKIDLSLAEQEKFQKLYAINPATRLRIAVDWMREHPGLSAGITTYYTGHTEELRENLDPTNRTRMLRVFLPVCLSQITNLGDVSRMYNNGFLNLDKYIVSNEVIALLESVETGIANSQNIEQTMLKLIQDLANIVLKDFEGLFPGGDVFSHKIYTDSSEEAEEVPQKTIVTQLIVAQLAALIPQYAGSHTVVEEICSVILQRVTAFLGSKLPDQITGQSDLYAALHEGIKGILNWSAKEKRTQLRLAEERDDALIHMVLQTIVQTSSQVIALKPENLIGVLALKDKVSSTLFVESMRDFLDEVGQYPLLVLEVDLTMLYWHVRQVDSGIEQFLPNSFLEAVKPGGNLSALRSFLRAEGRKNASSGTFLKWFERWIQFSIQTGKPISIEDLKSIGATAELTELNACFELVLKTPKPVENNTKVLIDFFEAHFGPALSITYLLKSPYADAYKVAAIAKILRESTGGELESHLADISKAKVGSKPMLPAVLQYMIESTGTDEARLEALKQTLSSTMLWLRENAEADETLLRLVIEIVVKEITTLPEEIMGSVKRALVEELAFFAVDAIKGQQYSWLREVIPENYYAELEKVSLSTNEDMAVTFLPYASEDAVFDKYAAAKYALQFLEVLKKEVQSLLPSSKISPQELIALLNVRLCYLLDNRLGSLNNATYYKNFRRVILPVLQGISNGFVSDSGDIIQDLNACAEKNIMQVMFPDGYAVNAPVEYVEADLDKVLLEKFLEANLPFLRQIDKTKCSNKLYEIALQHLWDGSVNSSEVTEEKFPGLRQKAARIRSTFVEPSDDLGSALDKIRKQEDQDDANFSLSIDPHEDGYSADMFKGLLAAHIAVLHPDVLNILGVALGKQAEFGSLQADNVLTKSRITTCWIMKNCPQLVQNMFSHISADQSQPNQARLEEIVIDAMHKFPVVQEELFARIRLAASHNQNDLLDRLVGIRAKADPSSSRRAPRDVVVRSLDVAAVKKTYKAELGAVLDKIASGKKDISLPVYWNNNRIQNYLIEQIKDLETRGKFSGASVLIKILESGDSFENKLELIGAIAKEKAGNRFNSIGGVGRRHEVQIFYQSLAEFSQCSDQTRGSEVLAKFLKATKQIDSSVDNVEHYAQRRALIQQSKGLNFETYFKRWIALSLMTGKVEGLPRINIYPSNEEARNCWQAIKCNIEPSETERTAPEGSGSEGKNIYLSQDQQKALIGVLARACIMRDRNGSALWSFAQEEEPTEKLFDEFQSIVTLLNTYEVKSGDEKIPIIVKMGELCNEDQLLQLKQALEKFRGATQGSKFFAHQYLPTGMQKVVDMINETVPSKRATTVEILAKLKGVAESRINDAKREERDVNVTDAYAAIASFFSDNSAPRTIEDLILIIQGNAPVLEQGNVLNRVAH